MVICSSSKDYELQSWNEQGEIFKKEGMLTIAFCFIFPCTHIDQRKELYLIIKIPYMVDMPLEKKAIPKSVELLPADLPKAFREQRDEIEKLKSKMNNIEFEKSLLNKEIEEALKRIDQLLEENKKQKEKFEKLKKENHQLKILCGKADRGWRQELDWVFYYEPDTGKPIGYECPYNFSYDEVRSVRYFLKEGEEWCNFWHGGRLSPYKMPKDAFLWLQGKLPEQKKAKTKKSKTQKLEFKDKNDIIKHLEESNEDFDDLKYLATAIDFLWDHKGKKFGTHDFQRESKISSSSTVQIYLKMFIRCNIIIFLKKGWYVVNIK